MKRVIFLTLFTFLVALSFAQDTVMVYFDNGHHITSQKNAFTWGAKYRAGDSWRVNNYNTEGSLESSTTYSDKELQIREGPQVLYSEKGKQLQLLTYTANKLNGSFNYYYENGDKQMEGYYTMDKKRATGRAIILLVLFPAKPITTTTYKYPLTFLKKTVQQITN